MPKVKIIHKSKIGSEEKKHFKIVKNDEQHVYDAQKRVYIAQKNKEKGEHIFDSFDVYFIGENAKRFRNATEKGLNNLLKVANLEGLVKVNYMSLERTEGEKFLNNVGTSLNNKAEVIVNLLSGYGTQKRAYQVLIGNFDTGGLDGLHADNAFLVNGHNDEKFHEYLVSHEGGHMFGAASGKNRTNIQNLLGPHCFDKKLTIKGDETRVVHTPCIMRQDIGGEHFEVLKKVGNIYCPDCVKDIREYVKKK